MTKYSPFWTVGQAGLRDFRTGKFLGHLPKKLSHKQQKAMERTLEARKLKAQAVATPVN